MRFRKVGEGKFTTRSQRTGEVYRLENGPGGTFCSCRAFFYGGACKHSRALVAKLEREARKRQRDGQRQPVTAGSKLEELFPKMDVARQPDGSYKLVEVL